MSASPKCKPNERRQSFRANVVALNTLGVDAIEIADRLGVSRFAVESVFRRKRGAKKNIQKPRNAAASTAPACEVPRWVPDNLVGIYLDVAGKQGEEHAASVVRRLKAEVRP